MTEQDTTEAPAATGTAEVTDTVDEATKTVQDFIDANVVPKAEPPVKDAEPSGAAAQDGGEPKGDKAATPPAGADGTRPTQAQIDAAKHRGYSDEDTKDFSAKDWKQVARESAAQRRLEQQLGRLQQTVQGLKGKAPAPESASDGEAAGEPDPAKDESLDLDKIQEITADDDIDAVVAKVNRNQKAMIGEIKRLREASGEVVEHVQATADAQVAQETDKFFESLPAEFFSYGGKPFSGLEPDSPEREAAQEIILLARRQMDVLGRQGRSPTVTDALDAAVRIAAKDSHDKWKQDQVRQQFARKEAGATARPSGTAPLPRKDADPEAEARAVMREAAAAMGLPMGE